MVLTVGNEFRGGTVLVPFVHHKSHTDWPKVEHKNNKCVSVV
jgi:hypothetical protein